MTFSSNKAVVGAAVYTNQIRLCSWTGALGGNESYFDVSSAFRWQFINYRYEIIIINFMHVRNFMLAFFCGMYNTFLCWLFPLVLITQTLPIILRVLILYIMCRLGKENWIFLLPMYIRSTYIRTYLAL